MSSEDVRKFVSGPYVFYYTPLTYQEYLDYGWDKDNPRYISLVLLKHVKKCTNLAGIEKDFNIEDFENKPGILSNLLNAIYRASEYDELMSPQAMRDQLKIMGTYLKTEEGLYDTFIFYYLGLEGYKISRESHEIRLKLISLIQETTGVVLEERWKEAARENKPVDITIRSEGEDKEQKITEQGAAKLKETGHDPRVAQQMANELRQKIEQEKRTGKKKKYYNWQEDLKQENASKDTVEWNS